MSTSYWNVQRDSDGKLMLSVSTAHWIIAEDKRKEFASRYPNDIFAVVPTGILEVWKNEQTNINPSGRG